jgi:hypothetical protein
VIFNFIPEKLLMSQVGTSNFYTRATITTCFIYVLLMGMGVSSMQGQSFDHESYPKLDFDFISLELDLGLQPQNLRIDGAATYQLKANISDADTVTLYAAHMDISNVTVDGNNADFMLHNDSLFVPLSEPSEVGQEYEVEIRYSGNPKFGLLKNGNSTVRTSHLPKTQRHWVPIIDNPHVDLKTTFNIAVPSGYQVWATGQKTGEETVSVDVMRYHFASEKEIPASSLALAVGKFDSRSLSKGSKKINLAVERALSDAVDRQQLLQRARDYLGQAEDYLQMDFPYDQLTILVMDDHQWETKTWSASTIHLYRNQGDLETQLLRGIIGQWFGAHQREIQWNQADAITLQQALVYQSIADSNTSIKEQDTLQTSFSTVYEKFGVENWNSWFEGWNNWNNDAVKTVIKDTQKDVLKNLSAVVSWNDYAEYWYQESGQPLFEIPGIVGRENITEGDATTETEDSVAYKVTYDLNEDEGQLKLSFEAIYGIYKELTSINAYEVYPNGTDTSEVTFTGAEDAVVLQVDPMISTLRLEAPDRPGLYLDEYKPSSFLINELRNAESVEQRASAARKLGVHSDNPDLQLAIQDFMSRELEPEVRAALLSSYADITNGATGTETTFLDALKSDNQEIRDAGLMALQNYKDNSQVQSQVEQLAENAGSFEFYQKAVQVLVAIASPDQFSMVAERITQQDTVGKKSIFVIQQLANIGEVEEAIKRAGLFIGDEYRYDIRSTALKVLIQHDHAPSNWLTRGENLLDTSDPRIRFLVIQGMEKNQNGEIRNFLSDYIQDEYDARVYQKIEQLLY